MGMLKEDRNRDQAAMRQVGQRIRLARKAKGLTLEKVAEAAETSIQFLTQLEKGEQCMTAIKFGRLAQALGVSTDYLLFGRAPAQETAALVADYMAGLNPIERELLSQNLINLRRLMDAIAPES
ncbi:MAG: helix-turn-helix domain-containing protein [Oscillospiraceae bacterium]|nr:helix-turn-helix domain-containing protein [Oscillospiraceae bacterium]